MICRRNYINNLKERDIVWFGSCGKKVEKSSQILKIENNETILDEKSTTKNQRFYLNFTNNKQTTINLYGFNNNIIDTYTTTYVGQHKLTNILTEELYKIEVVLDDFDDDIEFILEEYATAIFYDGIQHNNFSEKQSAIADSLIQSLSVLKNELWYDYTFGLPIDNKEKSKLSIDIFIVNTITNNSDVKNISKFNSYIENNEYHCEMIINSIYGDIEINI